MEVQRKRFDLSTVSPRKVQLAHLLDRTHALRAMLALQALSGAHVRCVNYHSVPPQWADRFSQQLQWLREHFEPVGYQELVDLCEGRWKHRRPGLVISFDDGCRTNAEVAAPLLEQHGFAGWFFVPAAFPDVPPHAQSKFARNQRITAWSEGEERLALTWDQVRELDRRHIVGCHSMDHVRLVADLGEEELRRQIIGGKRHLEAQLGHEVNTFSWVGGEEWGYSAPAARVIAEAGFRFVFGTNNQVFRPGRPARRIERTNVESYFPPALVRFQLSGILDMTYASKRRRLRHALEVLER